MLDPNLAPNQSLPLFFFLQGIEVLLFFATFGACVCSCLFGIFLSYYSRDKGYRKSKVYFV